MGADNYTEYRAGKDASALFAEAVDEAQHDYGHAGYTGTIAEKSNYELRNGGKPIPIKEAFSFAETDTDDNDKWGPSFALAVKADDSNEIVGYLFYGYASS